MDNNIASERTRAGMTQEQLGHALGTSQKAISQWENGKATPRVATIVKMAKLFGCTSDYLLALTDERLRR